MFEAEQRLSDLGYWIGAIDGYPDETTRFAALAFQRESKLPPTGVLTQIELQALRVASPIRPQITGMFHIEVNLSKQLLFIVTPNGTVENILPVNTGSGKKFSQGGRTRRAYTPIGTFTVYRKIEAWRQSPLGMMYYPSYIQGGVAIHGSQNIPKFPSTFGCIAVPLFAAEALSKLMPIGTIVFVYKEQKRSTLYLKSKR